NVCTAAARTCLEPDAKFTAVADDYGRLIASRCSVLYDWTDVSSTAGRQSAGIADDDDKIALPSDAIAYAVARSGIYPSTHRLASALSTNADYGRPGEELCQIFKRHGWDCAGLGVGTALLAPTGFDGVAISEDKIRWSWTPLDSLADKYTLVNA